jgi:ligand-binding sensor domain-containing protein
MPGEHALAQELNRDPYFTPTEAKSTSYMPRVIIRNIREDRAGSIWFATFGGPIRYDGRDFTNFSEEVGLANTRVFSLQEDRSGALWFGSITGGASRSMTESRLRSSRQKTAWPTTTSTGSSRIAMHMSGSAPKTASVVTTASR